MKKYVLIVIAPVLIIALGAFYYLPNHSDDGKLLGEPGCGKGYVDSLITFNGHQYHLLYRAYIIDERENRYPAHTYTVLVESKDDPQSFENLIQYCKEHTGLNFRPSDIILYTNDSTLYPIIKGDYSSVVGMSIYEIADKGYRHHGYILSDTGYVYLGIQKSVHDKEMVYIRDIDEFYLKVRGHSYSDAYFIIGSQSNFH